MSTHNSPVSECACLLHSCLIIIIFGIILMGWVLMIKTNIVRSIPAKRCPSDAHPMDTYDQQQQQNAMCARIHLLWTRMPQQKRSTTAPNKPHKTPECRQQTTYHLYNGILCRIFIFAFRISRRASCLSFFSFLIHAARICERPGSLGTHSVPCNGTHKGKIIGSSYDRLAPRICA